jgi:hypothetical protein
LFADDCDAELDDCCWAVDGGGDATPAKKETGVLLVTGTTGGRGPDTLALTRLASKE